MNHTDTTTTSTPSAGRTRMAADVDAPDKVAYGLTFRQLAILAVAAVIAYTAWRHLHRLLPAPVLAGGLAVLAALAVAVAVGRRDGLGLDVWLRHAVAYHHAPKRRSAAPAGGPLPDWIDTSTVAGRPVWPAPLRLPAEAIAADGTLALAGGHAVLVAATTVNLALRTGEEQAALIDTFGRWLNSLSRPTQILLCAQPVDLAGHARRLHAAARALPHPRLTAACADHADFLQHLAESRDPLRRQVLITTRAGAGDGEHAARRHGEDTVRALAGLGVTCRALDAAAAATAIAAAADPYTPTHPGARATPTTPITTAAAKAASGWPTTTTTRGRTR